MERQQTTWWALTWKGVIQIGANDAPMLFKTKKRAQLKNSARCKPVRVSIIVVARAV